MNRLRSTITRWIAVPIEARYHPNDPFGYSVYRVVAFMPPGQVARVETLRRQSGMKRSLIPAHVEVKGDFCDVDSLDTVRARTRRIARKTAPMHLEFADGGKLVFLESSAVIRIQPTEALATLTTLLKWSIGRVSTDAYRDIAVSPHLPICEDCAPDQLRTVFRRARELCLGTGFRAEAIDLVGRVGSAYEGQWESIEHFKLQD